VIRALALAAAGLLVTGPTTGDQPAGYWYGTDSSGITIAASGHIFEEPAIGGAYGGYFGMIGDWAAWQGCRQYQLAWSATDAADAHANYVLHQGTGIGAYWFMGGPGVDPDYDGTAAEASRWGGEQAARLLADVARQPVDDPVLWMDIELPGSKVFDPVVDNGWTDVYTSACSGRPRTPAVVGAALNRADLDGFAAWVVGHSKDKVGIYSSPLIWPTIFGTGLDAELGNTYEWSYSAGVSSLARHPAGWCLAGTSTCAEWFGGITSSSPYALMWQWSGGGGTTNGIGDFDQIDVTRTDAARG
jgi:hypothetical protein